MADPVCWPSCSLTRRPVICGRPWPSSRHRALIWRKVVSQARAADPRPPRSSEAWGSLLAGEVVEIGENCRDIVVGEADLRHLLVLGNHPFRQLLPQLPGSVPAINVAHGRRRLERAPAGNLDGV